MLDRPGRKTRGTTRVRTSDISVPSTTRTPSTPQIVRTAPAPLILDTVFTRGLPRSFPWGDRNRLGRMLRLGVCVLPDRPFREAAARWRRAEELGFEHAW